MGGEVGRERGTLEVILQSSSSMHISPYWREERKGDVAAWFGSNPSVPAACDGASELLGKEGCKANGFETFDQIYFWKTPIAACGNGQDNCVTYDRWVEEFTKIVGQ